MAEVRLQRFLSQAGIASRRHAEELMVQGRVRVNGRAVTELGSKVDPARDRVTVDRVRVHLQEWVYLVMNKPPGTVTTLRDPERRRTVGDLVPRTVTARVYPVGRLDYDTEGVLLLTNDGDLAHALLHPRRGVPRIYHAKLKGRLAIADLERLRRGVVLEDGRRASGEVFVLQETEKNTWIELGLTEGRTHEVKQMGDAIGHPVLKLIRVSFAGQRADGLRPGESRPLTEAEIDSLRRVAGLGSLRRAVRAGRS